MAKFTKFNNPSKKRKHYKHYDRAEADIIAAKRCMEDREAGLNLPLSYYDSISDKLSGHNSRHIYD